MLTNRRDVRIVWGDCDPAGIVYYPRYFEMFDTSTTALFERALGMTKYQFLKHYESLGYPMVDTRARFLLPTRYGDDVVIETTITEIKRSSFAITHRLQGRRARGRGVRDAGLGRARSGRCRQDPGEAAARRDHREAEGAVGRTAS